MGQEFKQFSVQDSILILVLVFKISMKNANTSDMCYFVLCDLQCALHYLQRGRHPFPGNFSNGK